VYLYERAAATPERANLADVRRGEYEGLRADVAEGRRLPDMGPHRIGRAGATAVGARPPLVAFNVYLSGSDERAAKDVAKRVRERSGGLVHVRAIGFVVPERACVQVSMNLLDPLATPPYRALELVRLEAARYGMRVLDTEIVGLIPLAALAESAAHYLQLRGFKTDAQVIETLVATHGNGPAVSLSPPGSPPSGGIETMAVGGFLDDLASARPTPGGGAAAATAGAAGAALLAMVARLTVGRKGYESLEGRMTGLVALADSERTALTALADRDSAAFDAVLAAHRMPRRSDEERAARTVAVQTALSGAARVPLEVARRAAALLPTARELVETGNVNAVSDAFSAGHLLHTAVAAGLANVSVNLAAMTDAAQAEGLRTEAQWVKEGAAAQLAAVEAAFTARLSGTA
jgi:glutamate formiminotransferase/formiminotetrahydrofolate cyclodeaminase